MNLQKIFLFLKSHLPLVIFHLIFLVIVIMNFPLGKYFIGWDSVTPEFNFALNFKRAFTAFWQENYGVGLLGGHGFAATLPHTIFTWLTSFFLPTSTIRPFFTFVCLYIGGLGIYFLIQLLLHKIYQYESKKKSLSLPQWNIAYIALAGALFYMLNLGTVEMFYIQLEAFIIHFAALPWLFLSTINLLNKFDKKNVLIFILVSLLASGQGFIPPLFIAYIFAISIFLGIYFLYNKSFVSVKKILLIGALIIITNLYWLVPFGYYTVTRSNVYLNSYNNLTSTPEFINKNKKYGDIGDVSLIKGFIFETIESSSPQGVTYIFQPWVFHHQKEAVLIVGYSFFAIIIFGLIYSLLYSRNLYLMAFEGVFLFFFTGLTTDFPPFSWLTMFLQNFMPIYRQAFRAAFTKFSLGTAFAYSIFFSVGIFFILLLINKYIKKRALYIISMVLIIGSIIFYSFPVFKGYFLYRKITLDIPAAYFNIMDYFKTQPDGRIADFPQDCAEGWVSYSWNYTGSGFYWYGVKQPFLSRTFDVWSNNNENYYWEVTQALREQNYNKVDQILDKYAAKWLLYDPNILHCRNQKVFFNQEGLLNYLQHSPKYKLINTFTSPHIFPILLYARLNEPSQSYIKLSSDLPNIGPHYNWTDNDNAYLESQNYITNSDSSYDTYFPFRSLFSKRRAEDNEFAIKKDNSSITFENKIPANNHKSSLKIDNLAKSEKVLFVSIQVEPVATDIYQIKLDYNLPQIYINDQSVIPTPSKVLTEKLHISNLKNARISINGQPASPITNNVYQSYFSTSLDNTITISDSISQQELFKWDSSQSQIYKNTISNNYTVNLNPHPEISFSVKIPITDNSSSLGLNFFPSLNSHLPKPCNEITPSYRNKFELVKENTSQFIRLQSNNSRQCIIYNLDQLMTSVGYLVQVNSRNIDGNNPALYISNKKDIHYLDINIYNSKDFADSYYIVPPTFPSELGYDIYFDNYSQNNTPTINDFKGLSINYIPYNFLSNLKIEPSGKKVADIITPKNVTHPLETLYTIQIDNPSKYLILSQSYDKGWKAYKISPSNSRVINKIMTFVPFFFGKEVKQHVLVDNWANGWQIEKGSYVIVFIPQYLQYIAFVIVIGGLIAIISLFPTFRMSRIPRNHGVHTIRN